MSTSLSSEQEAEIVRASNEFVDAAVARANEKIRNRVLEDGYISYVDAIKLLRHELGYDVLADNSRCEFADPDDWAETIEQIKMSERKENKNA